MFWFCTFFNLLFFPFKGENFRLIYVIVPQAFEGCSQERAWGCLSFSDLSWGSASPRVGRQTCTEMKYIYVLYIRTFKMNI